MTPSHVLLAATRTSPVPGAPDGAGRPSRAVGEDRGLTFLEAEGEASAECDPCRLGFRMLSDDGVDGGKAIPAGRSRILTQPERRAASMGFLPILRRSRRTAIQESARGSEFELSKDG